MKRILALAVLAALLLPWQARADSTVVSLPAATTLIGSSTYLNQAGTSNNQLLFNPSLFTLSGGGILTLLSGSVSSTYLSPLLSPGSCTSCNLSYDAAGRILSATNGSGGGGSPAGSNQAAQINSSGSFGAIGPTASNLFGWNASGIATPIVLGTNLSLSGSTLNATGGGGTPGGSNGQIQYNNSGAFGGFTFSGGMTVTPSTGVAVLGNPGPSTLGGIESIAQVGGEFVQYIDTSGVPHLATPSGGGNFSGPGSAVANDLVSFSGTSGTVGQDSGILSTNVVTAAATLTSNALTLGGGSKAVSVLGSLGTTTTLLHGNGAGPPSFGAVVLTTDVSGVLPLANGGSNAALTAAAGAVPYSTGSALALLAAGTSGQFLESQGAAPPIWGSPSGSGTVGSCSTADALAYYAATGTTTSCLAGVGTSGQVLTSNGTGVAPTFQAAGGFTAPTLSPGLATTPGTYNAGAQTLTSGSTLSPQIFYKAETSSCTLNSTCNSPSTNDTGLLPTFTNASLTGTLPNPSTVGSGSYQIGYDGTHSYSVTTVGGTASIYGCGTAGTTVSGIAYQTQFVTDGTNWQCIPSGGSSGSGTVTSIAFSAPLTGGTITTTGTVGLGGPSNLTTFTPGTVPMGAGTSPFVASEITDASSGGVVIGSATGGQKGAGTINMQGCYINNVACASGSSSLILTDGVNSVNPTGQITVGPGFIVGGTTPNATLNLTQATNVQSSGTSSYALLAGDASKLVVMSDTGPVTNTIPASTGSFGSGYLTSLMAFGGSTFSPTTNFFDGNLTSYKFGPYQYGGIASLGGTLGYVGIIGLPYPTSGQTGATVLDDDNVYRAVSLTTQITGVLPNANTNIGTSGATIPLNNGNNTQSGNNTFSGSETFTGAIVTGQMTNGESSQPSATTYTILVSDCGTTIDFGSNSPITVTVPNGAFPASGQSCNVGVTQSGTGQISFVQAAGATLRSAGALTHTNAQFSGVGLQGRPGGVWYLFGDRA